VPYDPLEPDVPLVPEDPDPVPPPVSFKTRSESVTPLKYQYSLRLFPEVTPTVKPIALSSVVTI